MAQPPAEFCPQCSRVNFNFIAKTRRRNSIDQLTPDVVWESLFPDYCKFCQLLSHSLQYHPEVSSPLHGFYCGQELQLYVDEEGTTKMLDYSIRPCSGPASIGYSELAKESARFDHTEMKAWFEGCERHKCLPDDHSGHSLPEGFRLIDVQRNCVVQPKGFVRYCALSYVWGSVKQVFLTSYDSLESPNALIGLQLPRTILDAMALCRDIGCRYLWVDSLCIVQDSKENKHRQISAMADVYSQSYLAIISATGEDANAGLPPYGTIGREFPISYLVRHTSVGSFVSSFCPQIAAKKIGISTWASRGWTLQEYALSRRVLFFAGTYVFLRCEKSLLCEDFRLGFSGCSGNGKMWDLPIVPFYRRSSDPNRYYPRIYGQLLCQYMRRRLTHDEDILDAFTGILSRIEGEIGKHIRGLPSKEFGAALQWKTDKPFPIGQRYGFPSWSWAGWIHKPHLDLQRPILDDLYEDRDEKMANISALTCYMVSDDNDLELVQKCDVDGICSLFASEKKKHKVCGDLAGTCSAERECRRLFASPSEPPPDFCTTLQGPYIWSLSQHLFIWGSCASLFVDWTPTNLDGFAPWEFAIRIRRDTAPLASIDVRPEWRAMETKDCLEFFVSTVGVHFGDGDPTLPTVELRVRVILVQRLHDSNPPIYRRIQVSNNSIRLTDWILANPKRLLIGLV
jgi:hypothetical protein